MWLKSDLWSPFFSTVANPRSPCIATKPKKKTHKKQTKTKQNQTQKNKIKKNKTKTTTKHKKTKQGADQGSDFKQIDFFFMIK